MNKKNKLWNRYMRTLKNKRLIRKEDLSFIEK